MYYCQHCIRATSESILSVHKVFTNSDGSIAFLQISQPFLAHSASDEFFILPDVGIYNRGCDASQTTRLVPLPQHLQALIRIPLGFVNAGLFPLLLLLLWKIPPRTTLCSSAMKNGSALCTSVAKMYQTESRVITFSLRTGWWKTLWTWHKSPLMVHYFAQKWRGWHYSKRLNN